ncbi:MAG TPA: NADH-ubiquinone oxidoreductase-F iron-sulfur binding region domain-containing protein [Gaiellaceae bacterium]|jgi:NADH:ubiquinone oxidoreductase subunit F (NADH-binding)
MAVTEVAPRAQLPRLLAAVRADGSPVQFDEHLSVYGTPPVHLGGRLIDLVEASGLTGRGGAGFPTATKLRAVAARRGRKFVVANGTEGEPLSRKDKALLGCVPHLVLDGAALAATAVGVDEVVVAVGKGAVRERTALTQAVAERTRRGLDRVRFQVAAAPDGFVVGEETALLAWLSGHAAKPTLVPPRPFERGMRGRPTLVQNVETLAQIALIARYGTEWFRELGTGEEPGSALVTLSGAVARPGVYEVGLGMPIRELIEWAGGTAEPVSAYLIGGYFGSWVAAADAERAALLDSQLSPLGASLGARTLFVLPARVCGIAETARLARYLASESAGQCGPCVHGLDAIAGGLEQLARPERADHSRLERWLEQVRGRGACRHPDGAVRLVASALDVFAREVELHAAGRCTGDGQVVLPTGTAR